MSQRQKPAPNSLGSPVVQVPPVPALRHVTPAFWRERIWPWGIVVAVGVGIGVFWYTQAWMDTAPIVSVEVVGLAPVSRILGVNGRIAAAHSVDVRSQVAGKISAIDVVEGDAVALDQVLLQIAAQVQVAVVRQAVAGLDAAIVTQQKARQDYNRAVLLGDNITLMARADAANALKAADQEVARYAAVLEQAQAVLENYTVRAPIAGHVLLLQAEVGQTVGATTALLTLVDTHDFLVEADVDEAYATQISRDQIAVLRLAGETEIRAGHVSFVSTRVDMDTGGLAIKLAFDAPVTAPVGMTVTANIVVDARDAALTVNRAAMTEGGVFVVQDGMAVARSVSVIEWPASRLIVTDGLYAGDMVIIEPTGIESGQAVRVEQP